jgi:hypothetical protein
MAAHLRYRRAVSTRVALREYRLKLTPPRSTDAPSGALRPILDQACLAESPQICYWVPFSSLSPFIFLLHIFAGAAEVPVAVLKIFRTTEGWTTTVVRHWPELQCGVIYTLQIIEFSIIGLGQHCFYLRLERAQRRFPARLVLLLVAWGEAISISLSSFPSFLIEDLGWSICLTYGSHIRSGSARLRVISYELEATRSTDKRKRCSRRLS